MAAVTLVALLAVPLPALASFQINIFNAADSDYDGTGFTVTDNLAGDLNSALGVIKVELGLGGLPAMDGFSGGIDTSQSNSPGAPPSSFLSLRWDWDATGDTGGTVQVTVTADGYTFPITPQSVLTSDVGGTLLGSGSVNVQQWVDQGGGNIFTPGPQPTVGSFGPGAFSNTASVIFASAIPYSITDRLNLTLGAGSSTSGGLQSTVVPEPVTMFLGGSGLLMLTYAARRRLFGR
jgi:hypothetical protein